MIKPTIAELIKSRNTTKQNRNTIVSENDLKFLMQNSYLSNQELCSKLLLSKPQMKHIREYYLKHTYIYCNNNHLKYNPKFMVSKKILIEINLLTTTFNQIMNKFIKNKNDKKEIKKQIENLTLIILSSKVETPPYCDTQLLNNISSKNVKKESTKKTTK